MLKFPSELNIVTADRDLIQGYASDPLNTADPAALARPRSEAELQAILRYCHGNGISVTACGNRTSLTGAALSHGGLALSTELLAKDWRCYEDPQMPGRWLVDAGPALLLSDFQDQLAARGFFYPPDPTSRKEVLLGATVATNASGEDSYRYGATRAWVRGVRFVKADGSVVEAHRAPTAGGSRKKNTCGFPYRDDVVDLLVGSEGTLGIITRLTLEVLPQVPRYFAILTFFHSEHDALAQVVALDADPRFSLRCLEYMDQGALAILREKASGLAIPAAANCALYLKEEYEGDEPDEALARWLDYFDELYADHPAFAESVVLAQDHQSLEQLRDWRHLIPAAMNEMAAHYRKQGGGKVGTDWYVPLSQLQDMFLEVRKDQDEVPWIVFGHIGNGHPHFNFLARNGEEYARSRALLTKHCRMAVAHGGGVSGEHGLGKLKTHLLEVQYSPEEIAAMKTIKQAMDPKGILAPGNIFPESFHLPA